MQHFDQRLHERYGVKLKKKQKLQILNLIRSGRVQPVKRYDDGHSAKYVIKLDGRLASVVYSSEFDSLITVLFPTDRDIFRHNKGRRQKWSKYKREDNKNT